MNKDTYGEVINGPETFRRIAEEIETGGRMLVGWIDESGTHFDILFAYQTAIEGNNIQGGIKASDLFVSIMRWGAFGFEVSNEDTHAGYFEEKLGARGGFGKPTRDKLAELINGVKRELMLLKNV